MAMVWSSTNKNSVIALSADEKTCWNGGTNELFPGSVLSDPGVGNEKKYIEIHLSADIGVGVYLGAAHLSGYDVDWRPGFNGDAFGSRNNSYLRTNGIVLVSGGNGSYNGITCTGGEVVGVAIDGTTGEVWLAVNNVWAGGDPAAGTNPVAYGFDVSANGEIYIALAPDDPGNATHDNFTIISTGADQTYTAPTGFEVDGGGGGTTSVRAILDMPYSISVAALRALLEFPYSIFADRRAALAMLYSLRLGAHVDMRYGDCPELRSVMHMHYSDCPLLRRALVMSYDDLLMHRAAVDMEYAIPKTLTATMEMRYSIAAAELRGFCDMSYDLLVNNPLRGALVMPYLMEGDGLVRSVDGAVVIGGRSVGINHLAIEPDQGLYCIPVEIHLTRESDYYQIARGDAIEVSLDATTYSFVVETMEISRNERSSITWVVKGLSPAVWLSAPWSRPVLREFADGSAVSVIEELIAEVPQLSGLAAVDWQIADFPVVGLYANDEDRHEIITKILQTVDAVLLSNPDGSLRVEYEEPADLLTREPDYYISSERNFISADETTLHVEGWNRFLIGNQLASEERLFAEQRDISSTVKEVLGFQTPWDAALVVVLQHSGGEWVPEPEYMGVIEEIYPPATEPAEQVEFVAGFAQTSRPIYDDPEITWTREQLGAITWAEDGRLEAELKDGRTDGYSLAEVRYLTRYHLWRVRNDRDEDVQYLLRIVEDE